MPIVVNAVTAEYNGWVAMKKAEAAEAAAAADAGMVDGRPGCARRNRFMPGQLCGLSRTHRRRVSPVRSRRSPAARSLSADQSAHIDIVVNGKAGTAMAAFKGQLNDVDIAAVITFQRNVSATAWVTPFSHPRFKVSHDKPGLIRCLLKLHTTRTTHEDHHDHGPAKG